MFEETLGPFSVSGEAVQRLIASSLDCIVGFDATFKITVWNASFERLTNRRAEDALGKSLFQIFPELSESTLTEILFQSSTLSPYIGSLSDYGLSGRDTTQEQSLRLVKIIPVHEIDGRVVGGFAIFDGTESPLRSKKEELKFAAEHSSRLAAERAVRRFSFLAQASEALTNSLEYEQTLSQLAHLCIPELGDLCVVDICEGDEIRRVAVAHVSPQKAALLDEVRRSFPPTMSSQHPSAEAIRSGQLVFCNELTPAEVRRRVVNDTHAEILESLGLRSLIAVPLIARGVTLGAISVGITDSDRSYDEAEIGLAQELARRAAMAIDNARLYSAAQIELHARRKVESELRISEERFRTLMEQSPLSKQIFTSEGRLLRANRSWEKLWGISVDALPAYNVLQDSQLQKRGVSTYIERAFRGESVDVPFFFYDPSESLPVASPHGSAGRWIRILAYPMKDESGSFNEVVFVYEDVTEKVRKERALRESEERLRLALGAARMSVWTWDLRSDQIECAENGGEFWGRSLGTSDDFLATIHPDDQERVGRVASEGLVEGEPYQVDYRLVTPACETRWVQSRGRVEFEDGRPVRITGVTVDVTNIKAAESVMKLLAETGDALGASLDYHVTLGALTRLVVPAFADWCAVDLLREDGDLERIAVQHFDPHRAEFGRGIFTRFPPRRRDLHGSWRVLETGAPELISEISREVLESIAYDTEHLESLLSLGLRSLIRVPLETRGQRVGVLSLCHAESGRRFVEADVALARDLARRAAAAVDNARLYQKLRTEDQRKDEFLATLAHELRNPLAPLRTGLEVLRLTDNPAAMARTREMMDRQLSHLVHLVDDLLDLSRVTSGKVQLKRERLDVASVVSAAIEVSLPGIDASSHQLTVVVPDEPVFVSGDRTRLAQVLSNLLNNAAKYMEPRGSIEVRVVLEGADVVVSIRDTGLGIPVEMLSRVFDLFTQVGRSLDRSQGGLGIGLTLVRQLVELHGGRVWAESEGLGQGSTFSVRLPILFERGEVAGADSHHVAPDQFASRRILLVDDNQDAADSLSTLLEIAGHEVRVAYTGLAALDILPTFTPDVALLDIGLPGMSGYDLARAVRRRFPNITIVAVTGWGAEEDRRLARDAGFNHHLTKPVALEALDHILVPGWRSSERSVRPV